MATKRNQFVLPAILVLLWLGLSGGHAPAAEEKIPLKQTQGKTGAFAVTLDARSPLSKPSEITRRITLASKDQGADYDLSKEVFDLYIPREPDAAGKYGLMVIQNFKDAGHPAESWPAVLDKYHMIWLGARNSGDARPAIQKMGLILDEVHNAQATFAIDDRRIYFCPVSPTPPTSAMALYYADVFTGALCSIQWQWYADIREKNSVMKATIPRPDDKSLALARKRSRFVLVQRQSSTAPNKPDSSQLYFIQGYKAAGFQNVQLFAVPDEQMQHYESYSADWFDKALGMLDAPLAEQTAAKPSPAKTSIPPDAKPTSPDGVTNPPPADSAARALSLARSYIAAQHYDAARPRLETLIKTYPDTPAAAEAKTLLQQIQGK